MEKKILNKINRNGLITFVELEEIFEESGFDYKGEEAIGIGLYKNIYIWAGWNEKAAERLYKIMDKGSLSVYGCSLFIYLLEGKQLNWPIAKKLQDYKTKRWMPSVLKVDPDARK